MSIESLRHPGLSSDERETGRFRGTDGVPVQERERRRRRQGGRDPHPISGTLCEQSSDECGRRREKRPTDWQRLEPRNRLRREHVRPRGRVPSLPRWRRCPRLRPARVRRAEKAHILCRTRYRARARRGRRHRRARNVRRAPSTTVNHGREIAVRRVRASSPGVVLVGVHSRPEEFAFACICGRALHPRALWKRSLGSRNVADARSTATSTDLSGMYGLMIPQRFRRSDDRTIRLYVVVARCYCGHIALKTS